MTDLAKPGRKYAGKLKVGGGPVPIQKWTDRDRKLGPKGLSLRGEIKGKK
jgi:hypothetical protein